MRIAKYICLVMAITYTLLSFYASHQLLFAGVFTLLFFAFHLQEKTDKEWEERRR